MNYTGPEWWGLIHGMGFGALFLLAYAGGMADLYGLRTALVTSTGVTERMRRLRVGVTGMAVVVWLTVISGTFIVYPVYREATPGSPRSQLLADPDKASLHTFGMELKEHLAWISPILATAVAFIVLYYGTTLINHRRVRRTSMLLFTLAFAFAAVAGLLGALITKEAPVV